MQVEIPDSAIPLIFNLIERRVRWIHMLESRSTVEVRESPKGLQLHAELGALQHAQGKLAFYMTKRLEMAEGRGGSNPALDMAQSTTRVHKTAQRRAEAKRG